METKTPDTTASPETEMESPRKPNSTKCRNGEKIHEDEDSWISGEELYTEESTDDDDPKLSAELREMRRMNKERRKMKEKELASRKDERIRSGIVFELSPGGQSGQTDSDFSGDSIKETSENNRPLSCLSFLDDIDAMLPDSSRDLKKNAIGRCADTVVQNSELTSAILKMNCLDDILEMKTKQESNLKKIRKAQFHEIHQLLDGLKDYRSQSQEEIRNTQKFIELGAQKDLTDKKFSRSYNDSQSPSSDKSKFSVEFQKRNLSSRASVSAFHYRAKGEKRNLLCDRKSKSATEMLGNSNNKNTLFEDIVSSKEFDEFARLQYISFDTEEENDPEIKLGDGFRFDAESQKLLADIDNKLRKITDSNEHFETSSFQDVHLKPLVKLRTVEEIMNEEELEIQNSGDFSQWFPDLHSVTQMKEIDNKLAVFQQPLLDQISRNITKPQLEELIKSSREAIATRWDYLPNDESLSNDKSGDMINLLVPENTLQELIAKAREDLPNFQKDEECEGIEE